MKSPFASLQMTADKYRRLTAPFLKLRHGSDLLKWLNLLCSSVFYIAYPASLVILLFSHNRFVIQAILIPGISFLLISILRKCLNRPRPYETPGITPLLRKESRGASFPSRHVFSAFMIAATLSVISPLGYILFLPALLLAVVRVIGGVHHPLDVTVGAALAVLISLLYRI